MPSGDDCSLQIERLGSCVFPWHMELEDPRGGGDHPLPGRESWSLPGRVIHTCNYLLSLAMWSCLTERRVPTCLCPQCCFSSCGSLWVTPQSDSHFIRWISDGSAAQFRDITNAVSGASQRDNVEKRRARDEQERWGIKLAPASIVHVELAKDAPSPTLVMGVTSVTMADRRSQQASVCPLTLTLTGTGHCDYNPNRWNLPFTHSSIDRLVVRICVFTRRRDVLETDGYDPSLLFNACHP